MATLLLAAGASALAGSLGITGTLWATALSSAAYLAGGLIDSYLLSSLMPGSSVNNKGPRIQDIQVTTSTEGNFIPKLYGRMRVSGTLIWATKFREVVEENTEKVGGKGSRGTKVTTTTYTYFQSIAIGLCEGPIRGVGRMWADGEEMDLAGITFRVYRGTAGQNRDPKIQAVEGINNTSAYRNTAYIVFEELDLTRYGNRTPNITVEVFSLPTYNSDAIESIISGWDLMPATGEYVYSTENIFLNTPAQDGVGSGGSATTRSVTINSFRGKPDALWSLDQLEMFSPNTQTVALVVSWMGNDLRIGQCLLRPHVEATDGKETTPWNWRVSGVIRQEAQRVHIEVVDGIERPLIGGTPADHGVYQIIKELKQRGYFVVFYPFIMMDIVADEDNLPDPYGRAKQPSFPWRGRITCNPAADQPGTVDKTSAAATQVNNFFGNCQPNHFGNWTGIQDVVYVDPITLKERTFKCGGTIPYSGPDEWTFRRMILHYAKLCQQAGGVDAFIIGSEMVGMTQIRSSNTNYPAVNQLVTLAADVKSILGSTPVSYSADWIEYHSHRPNDGTNDVRFNLDPLWASSNIDFVSLDWYEAVTDWRDTPNHLDGQEYDSIYNLDYLKSRMQGGEDYDWYYASQADRDNQIRTPIIDTAEGKDWVFRQKDIRNWWLNQHYNRPGGVESNTPTGWVPESKPVWFLEMGVPSVDKGTNQPNVFFDPKSSESFLPRYSTGVRDDYIQYQFIRAFYEYWRNNANNPISSVYGQRMVNNNRTCVWNWDARPYPAYPVNNDAWSDGQLWWHGHWMTGRMSQVPLYRFIDHAFGQMGIQFDTTGLYGLIRGYILTNSMSVRDAMQALQLAFNFDSFESDGKIKFKHRGRPPVAALTEQDLVRRSDGDYPTYKMTRAQETELPHISIITYYDEFKEYQQATGRSARLRGDSRRVAESQLPLVMHLGEIQTIADRSLFDAWIMREKLEGTLPPSWLALDPSDVISFTLNGREAEWRMEQVGYEYSRPFVGLRTDLGLYVDTGSTDSPNSGGAGSGGSDDPGDIDTPTNTGGPNSGNPPQGDGGGAQPQIGPVNMLFMDMSLIAYPNNPYAPYLAGSANPWVGANIYRSTTTANFAFDTQLTSRSATGLLDKVYDLNTDVGSGPDEITSLGPGSEACIDFRHQLQVIFATAPNIQTISWDDFYGTTANVIAVRNVDNNNEWEIIQFRQAELVSGNTYRLRDLIRGQLGTEHVAKLVDIPMDMSVVLLTTSLGQSNAGSGQRNVPQYWKYGPASRGLDDSTYQQIQFTPQAKGLRPYSPTHLRMKPADINDLDGDMVISWIRRTRINASVDGWHFDVSPPLNEEYEEYRLVIYDGVTEVRVVVVNTPTFTYTAAMQVEDWGAPIETGTIEVGVAQRSNVFGYGIERREMLDIFARP